MLSHVEMAPAAGGFKLFGKVITQGERPAFVRERDDPDESDRRPTTVKREACEFFDNQQQQHGGRGGEEEEDSGNKARAAVPSSRQQQHQQADTAEARAAASAPPLPCPRCRSRNTKFCYFNNYNVNQPRHFCKDCHRYWTAGGALRNVPVGAGRRKNRPLVVPAHAHNNNHRLASAAAGFVLGFPPGAGNPSSSPTTSPVYAVDRWPVCPDRRF